MEKYSVISAYAMACRYIIDPVNYPIENKEIIFAASKTWEKNIPELGSFSLFSSFYQQALELFKTNQPSSTTI